MNRFVILLAALAAVAAAPRSSEIKEDYPVCYNEIISHLDTFQKSLIADGLWTYWDVEKGTIPPQAVFAGPGNYGPAFVMQADHTLDNGVHVGKHLGKFYPFKKLAYIVYGGKAIPKTHFELLLHENHAWTNKDDTRPLIPGPNRHICRGRIPRDPWIMSPGYVDGNTCRVPFDDVELVLTDYETLRRNCQ